MSSGERPIGTAKGKQSDTEALCQPPPPTQRSGWTTRPLPPQVEDSLLNRRTCPHPEAPNLSLSIYGAQPLSPTFSPFCYNGCDFPQPWGGVCGRALVLAGVDARSGSGPGPVGSRKWPPQPTFPPRVPFAGPVKDLRDIKEHIKTILQTNFRDDVRKHMGIASVATVPAGPLRCCASLLRGLPEIACVNAFAGGGFRSRSQKLGGGQGVEKGLP